MEGISTDFEVGEDSRLVVFLWLLRASTFISLNCSASEVERRVDETDDPGKVIEASGTKPRANWDKKKSIATAGQRPFDRLIVRPKTTLLINFNYKARVIDITGLPKVAQQHVKAAGPKTASRARGAGHRRQGGRSRRYRGRAS